MKSNPIMRIFLLIVISLSAWSFCSGQQEAMVSQYLFNGLYINPAYAGSHPYATASAIVRKQWVGIEGAPFSQFVSYEGPIKATNMGLGFMGTNDHIGVTYRTELFANYAYHLELGKQRLSLGIRAGGSLYSAKLADLVYWDPDDVVFQENIGTTFVPNFGFGAYFYGENYFIGAAIPNLISFNPDENFSINIDKDIHLVRHLYVNAGVVLTASEYFKIYPSFLLKYAKNTPLSADFNVMTLIGNLVWLGGSYRTGDAIIAMTGYQITKNIRLGYAYDYAVNPLSDYTSGTHEVSLGFDIGKEALKIKSPRFF
ncbi:MAG: type IX secretion system membrane protein PorP/SprF [Bacteroidota bacterium]